MKCLICNKEIGTKGFSTHIKQHNMSSREYYDILWRSFNVFRKCI